MTKATRLTNFCSWNNAAIAFNSLGRIQIQSKRRQVVAQREMHERRVGFGRFDESEQTDDAVLIDQHGFGNVLDRVVGKNLKEKLLQARNANVTIIDVATTDGSSSDVTCRGFLCLVFGRTMQGTR